MENKWTISNPNFESDIINDKLKVSPWCGHRDFIYDLLKYIKPQKIVELGTHYGCSYFAMCQSIKDNKLQSELYAIDTWRGDEQAGFYGDEVWEIVNKTKDTFFSNIGSKLMRMTFDEAQKQFEDEIFDVIHIDGLHTYDAVSHDYEMWLPKLKKNGVMLFHDVASYLEYGTNKFWEELQEKYEDKFLSFPHSWGLGILFPKGTEMLKLLQNNNIVDKMLYYQYKALYELENIKNIDLTKMADERFDAIERQSKMISERDETIQSQAKIIEERYEAIDSQAKMLEERYNAIEDQSKMIKERDEVIEAQAKMLEERYEAIEEQSKMIKERDEAIEAQAKMLEERYEAIQNQSQMIRERDETIVNLRKFGR